MGRNKQNLSFNVRELQPRWTPLFKLICNRLIATSHTSYIALDRAILLYAMIERRKVDAPWIIHNNMIDSIKSLKGLWFTVVITQLCINDNVEVTKNKEKIKVGLVISAKASSNAP